MREQSDAEARADFEQACAGLLRGDFTRLAPLFSTAPGGKPRIVTWVEQGWFTEARSAFDEALACACFLGETELAEYLLSHGADLVAGAATGHNGFHWAADRGHLDTVRMLLRHQMPLALRNRFGGTVLGSTIWSARHERRPAHLAIIEALLQAGARVEDADFPSGDLEVDALLRRYGACPPPPPG